MPSTRNTTAPEELDQVMTVVRPRTWLALSSVGLLLAAATAWAFLGVVTVKVTGQGILIRSGALFPIVAKTEGQLLSLTIEKGQYITKGQPVAALDQPLLRAELRETENYLGKLLVDQKQMATYERKHDELVDQFIEKQRTTLLESIRLGGQLVEDLQELVDAQEELQRVGVVSKLELEKMKAELRKAKIQRLQDHHELSGLEVYRQQVLYGVDQRLEDLTRQIVSLQERVLSLRERLDDFSVVRSLHSGVIIEIHKNPGEVLSAGDSLAYMELAPWEDVGLPEEDFQPHVQGPSSIKDDLLVVAYVPPFQGLELRPGMTAHVVPEMVREEEFGVILGEVVSISPFPVTPKGMMRVLDNPDLVHNLTQEGAPIMVTIRLQEDPSTASGYRWSSGSGPPARIRTGVQCVIRIIARTHSPLDLIVPELKRRFLGIGAETTAGLHGRIERPGFRGH